MRIKLDENLPVAVATVLTSLGHDVDTVVQQGFGGQPDVRVWEAAQASDRFFITQDLDFSDVGRFEPGTHHGLLVVRLREPGREALAERIRVIFAENEVNSWQGCFIVATDRKVRVRRPKPGPAP